MSRLRGIASGKKIDLLPHLIFCLASFWHLSDANSAFSEGNIAVLSIGDMLVSVEDETYSME